MTARGQAGSPARALTARSTAWTRLAVERPSAIGVPIPGGRLEVRPVEGLATTELGEDVGELVYHGPNVMMGYATTADDLADGATLRELRTGDLGRYDARHGVYEIVGRRSRFVKLFGLRVDLDRVEAELRGLAPEVAVTGDDERIVVAAPGAEPEQVRRTVATFAGVPIGAVAVGTDRPLPRTANGKTDYAAILADDRADRAARADDDDEGLELTHIDIFGLVQFVELVVQAHHLGDNGELESSRGLAGRCDNHGLFKEYFRRETHKREAQNNKKRKK